ncbi:MAG: Uma2 family endonuclease [Planctomycetes bacterium]|nr:Uma2 family endonuclease [Planctomycetota bacterium]
MSTITIVEPLSIGLEDNGLRMTPAEFDAVSEYDELYHYELIDGVLIVNPISGHAERDPNEELGHLLRTFRDDHPDVQLKTVFEEYVRLTSSRRRADRVIWAGLGRVPNPKEDLPTIVVEFVSKSRRDRRRDYVLKRDEYMELGIPEYWIIDRFQRTLTVYRQQADRDKPLVVAEKEIYRTPLLPGFELPLSRLLNIADDWPDD